MAPRKAKRRRDYAAEYAQRQERARERGFSSYYERRVSNVPRGERARVRGHRAGRDFLRELGAGDLIIVPEGIGSIVLVDRYLRDRRGGYVRSKGVYLPWRRLRRKGRFVRDRRVRYRLERVYERMTKLVIDAVTGKSRSYLFRNFTRDYLRRLIDEEEKIGAVWSPAPSLDQRRLDTARAES